MTWEPLVHRAMKISTTPRITIAAADMGRPPRQQVSITWRFAPAWFARGCPITLEVGSGADAGKLRISAGGVLTAGTVPSPGQIGVHVGQTRIGAWDGIASGKHAATECAFELAGEAVVIELPGWAYGSAVIAKASVGLTEHNAPRGPVPSGSGRERDSRPSKAEAAQPSVLEAPQPHVPATVTVTPVSPPAAPPLQDTRHKTPERVELLKRLWHTPGLTRADIRAQLNALPGREISTRYLPAYVTLWGVTKSAAAAICEPAPEPPGVAPAHDRFSVAGRLEASAVAELTDCPMSWPDALEWAIRNRPNGFDIPVTRGDVDRIRAVHGLPRFRIVQQLGPRTPLPASHVENGEQGPDGKWREAGNV